MPYSVTMQRFPETLKMDIDFSWVPSERIRGNGNKWKHGT